MFYDYHMHSNFSLDSDSKMEDMIIKSIDLGLKEICFTDHVDYDTDCDVEFNVDYKKYFSDLNYFKEKYKKDIIIKKGIEIGVQSHIINRCSKDVTNNDFDFVICSMHAVNTKDFYVGDYFNDKTQYEAYESYFLELYNIVKNYKDYSVLGHLDIIKRYGGYKSLLDDDLFSEIIESILKQVIEDNKGI